MKKLIALLLAMVMLLSLAACAKKDEKTDDKKDQSQSQQKDDDTKKNDDEDDTSDEATKKDELSFEEIVVVDNDLCLIKITDIDPDDVFGYTLKGYFENKSADKTLTFCAQTATINGIQNDLYFATDVAPGKKANESISFDVALLEFDGVGDFTDIELNFVVSDSEDWASDPLAEVTAHVYPYGEDKAVDFAREDKDTDTVLVDNEYVKVVAIGTVEDDWGYNLVLYMENKSDKNLTISADEVSVNGFMLDPLFGAELSTGNCSYAAINWFLSELEENSIEDVIKIEFKLYVTDSDDWEADDYAVETVTYNP